MTSQADTTTEADDVSIEAAMARFHRLVRTKGLAAAYEAAVDVASDKKAPAPARATAAATLMRAAGVLDSKNRDDSGGTPIDQMTPAQMAAEYRRLQAESADRAQRLKLANDEADIAVNVFD